MGRWAPRLRGGDLWAMAGEPARATAVWFVLWPLGGCFGQGCQDPAAGRLVARRANRRHPFGGEFCGSVAGRPTQAVVPSRGIVQHSGRIVWAHGPCPLCFGCALRRLGSRAGGFVGDSRVISIVGLELSAFRGGRRGPACLAPCTRPFNSAFRRTTVWERGWLFVSLRPVFQGQALFAGYAVT